MSDIAFSKVLEALTALGIDDAPDVREVHMDAHEVTVTRFNKVDGKVQLDSGGGVVLVESTHRIDYGFGPASEK